MKKQGFALVLVLGILVLMLMASLALFSKAQLQRQIISSSAANIQVEMLACTAMAIVANDIHHEIAAGSIAEAESEPGLTRSVFYPRRVDSNLQLLGSDVGISVTPTMSPQRTTPAPPQAPQSLVKQSKWETPFFELGDGMENHSDLPPIPERASSVPSVDPPFIGNSVSEASWRLPVLFPEQVPVSFPDWIYVNRSMQTPTSFSNQWSDSSIDNEDYIIGRFAFNLYDVGGLLDINIIGNLLESSKNKDRGFLHQVSLTDAPGDLASPDFEEFVNWRSPGEDEDSLFDSSRAFLRIAPGSQGFVNRQDLIRFVSRDDSPLRDDALPFLTVASRAAQSPMFSIDPQLMASQPADLSAPEINASLLQTRFPASTELSRGSGPGITVPAGTPIMLRKFPLSKIELLSDPNANPADIEYFFGLQKQPDDTWRYTATSSDGRIMRPEEIASQGREPNFFEILQATLPAGSLGRSAGNSYTTDHPKAILRNLQVIQIGANVIDQWDSDDFPTAIGFPSGNDVEWVMLYGVENLPYINSFEFAAHHPEWNQHRLQLWMLFSVWNPHQNAAQPAQNIAEFRIHPHSGRIRTAYNYRIHIPGDLAAEYGHPDASLQYILGNLSVNDSPNVRSLNDGRVLSFPNDGSYTDPRVVRGNAPESSAHHPGILLNHISMDSADAASASVRFFPPPVPENAAEVHPNVRNGHSSGSSNFPGVNQILEYSLKRKHTAEGLPPPTDVELENAHIPPDGTGFFGAKAFNYFRLRGVKDDRLEVHLQYRPAGSTDWKTYQVIEGLIPDSTDAVLDGIPADPNTRGFTAGGDVVIDGINLPAELDQEAERVKLRSASGWIGPTIDGVTHSFYNWRPVGSISGAIKADPRTVRFGHPGQSSFLLGDPDGLPAVAASQPRTIQSILSVPNWTDYSGPADLARRAPWLVGVSLLTPRVESVITGLTPNPYPDFEWARIPRTGGALTDRYTAAGFIRNIPEGSVNTTTNLSRYKDRDGIIRPADGYLGASPTVPVSGEGSIEDRPVILNRPFRSVAELGHVFRDLPWKNLDFFTRNSADLGLLDVFSIQETNEPIPLQAGKVNLNAAPVEVLATLLQGTARNQDGSEMISSGNASSIAAAIVQERNSRGPFLDAGDIVRRVLSPTSATQPGVLADVRKHEREAAIRTLAGIGTTRTWNFMLDLVTQVGRMRPNSSSADEFIVRAQKRYWVHFAVDRLTGEIIHQSWEVVDE